MLSFIISKHSFHASIAETVCTAPLPPKELSILDTCSYPQKNPSFAEMKMKNFTFDVKLRNRKRKRVIHSGDKIIILCVAMNYKKNK